MGQEWASEGQQRPVENCQSRPHIILLPALSTISHEKSSTLILPCDPLWIQPPPPFGNIPTRNIKAFRVVCTKSIPQIKKNCTQGSVVMPVPPVNRKARDQAARERRSLITDRFFELPENYNSRDYKLHFF